MRKGKSGVWVSIGILLLLSIVMLVACAPASSPSSAPATAAAKPAKIVIYSLGDLSGPSSAGSQPIVAGINWYVDWINSKGGYRGIPVAHVTRDTAGKLDQSMTAYMALKEMSPKPVVIITLNAADAEALRDVFKEDKVVNFANSAGPSTLYPPAFTFHGVSSYTDTFGAFIDWVTTDWAKKTGQKVKLAILAWDNTFGRAVLVDETRQYAKAKGVEIVAEELCKMTDVDVSTQLTKIKPTGANWIFNQSAVNAPAVVMKGANSLGIYNKNLYDTTPGMMHFAVTIHGGNTSTIVQAKAEQEGSVSLSTYPFWTDTGKPILQDILAISDKAGLKRGEVGEGYLLGWDYVTLINDAIGKASDAVGWDKVNGSAVKDQFIKMQDFNAANGLTPWTYTANKPERSKIRLFQVKSGVPTPITDWVAAPDLRPAKYK